MESLEKDWDNEWTYWTKQDSLKKDWGNKNLLNKQHSLKKD